MQASGSGGDFVRAYLETVCRTLHLPRTKILQREEPLTHRAEHHVLEGLKWQEVPKPISWHIIYKPSHFLSTFRATSQVSAELAKQMLQNLHVLSLPQKCHPSCSHWSLWFSGKRRERHKPNKLLSTQGLSPRAQPFCATWLHIVLTWGLWKHQWFWNLFNISARAEFGAEWQDSLTSESAGFCGLKCLPWWLFAIVMSCRVFIFPFHINVPFHCAHSFIQSYLMSGGILPFLPSH